MVVRSCTAEHSLTKCHYLFFRNPKLWAPWPAHTSFPGLAVFWGRVCRHRETKKEPHRAGTISGHAHGMHRVDLIYALNDQQSDANTFTPASFHPAGGTLVCKAAVLLCPANRRTLLPWLRAPRCPRTHKPF